MTDVRKTLLLVQISGSLSWSAASHHRQQHKSSIPFSSPQLRVHAVAPVTFPAICRPELSIGERRGDQQISIADQEQRSRLIRQSLGFEPSTPAKFPGLRHAYITALELGIVLCID